MTEAYTLSHPKPSAALLKGKKRTSGPSWQILLAILFLLVAFVAAGGAWFLQKRFEHTGREIAKQVQGLTSQLNEARQDSTQALGQAQSQARRIAQLEQAQLEAKSQYAALEQLWAGANKGTEDVMLANDVDRLLTTADQQLRLAGHVNNAIVTLEAAQSLLVRADRARFAGVQRAISLDLERLRAVPLIDIPQLSSRLETLSALVARAPMLLPDAAAPVMASVAQTVQRVPTPAGAAQASASGWNAVEQTWWQRALDQSILWSKSAASMVAREFAEVVSIQRVSDANALMMSPEQGALLRANLRSRVLTAQMALLMHQAPVWRAELAQVQKSLVSRFDPKATDTIAALRLVQELSAIQIAVSLPSIKDSLSALESVRSSEPSPAGGQ